MSTAHWRQNFTTNGRKCPTAKTKTVLKSVNKMEQLVGMSKSKREKNPNKNHPTERGIQQKFSSASPRQFFNFFPNHPPPDHNLGQIFKLRSRQLPISTKIVKNYQKMSKIIFFLISKFSKLVKMLVRSCLHITMIKCLNVTSL